MPSRSKSSVKLQSKATVTPCSDATDQPAISLDRIIKSEASKIVFFPLISMGSDPSLSMVWICTSLSPTMTSETAFISLPNRGPRVLKFGLISLTKIEEASSSISMVLTLTSAAIKSETSSMACLSLRSKAGINTR